MSESKHYRTCPLCEAVCGLEITVRDGEVKRIEGDRQDVFSAGFICPKGASLGAYHSDPDRLRAPLIRRGDDPDHASFEEVSWSEAYAEVERRLTKVLQAGDRNATAVYLGNPNAHNLSSMYRRPLIKALGTANVFTASTVDQMPKEVSSGYMFGNPFSMPVPDVDRTDFMLMLGANPWESNGSLCTAPNLPGRLKALRERGGRLVVVDPRRTRTAEHADEHIPIRPGTDAQLLLAMAHVVFSEQRVRLGRLAECANGLEAAAKACEPFTPGAVERTTGISAERIVALARELAETPRAVVYGRIGTHTVRFGTVAAWAVDLLNAITGHLDEPGGAMWPQAAHSPEPKGGPGRGFDTGRRRSRVRGYPEVVGEFPSATLAEEIETPGAGQIRALITVAGNPALSTPDSDRLTRALGQLDCMVSVDTYLNETTRFAHVILPPPSPLEKGHYDVALYNLAVRNVAKWSAPVFARKGPDESEILAKLALIAGGQGPEADPAAVHLSMQRSLLASAHAAIPALSGRTTESLAQDLVATDPMERVVEIMVRGGGYGDQFGERPGGLDFERLRAAQHGIDFGPLKPRLPQLLRTRSGKVELAPAPILDDVAEHLTQALQEPQPPSAALLLIGRRDLRSNNSWMHNVQPLAKGPERCTLQMHPSDADRIGIADGQVVEVRARVGTLRVRLALTDTIMPGVVSLPHGYGHDAKGARLQVAAERPGVNSNRLTDGNCLDPLSGNAVLNGIPVSVLPASA